MKYLLYLTLLPLSALSQNMAPSCRDLARYLTEAEKKFQSSSIGDYNGKNCTELKASDFYTSEALPSKDIIGDNSVRCANLGTLQAKLETLRLRQSVFDGFRKLKNQVQEAKKEVTRNLRNGHEAKRHGKTFVQRLGTAYALELLLNSKERNNGPSFMQHLKNRTDINLEDPKNFQAAIVELCQKKHQSAPICDVKDFDKKPQVVQDLASFIRSVQSNELNDNTFEQWKRALSIRKKGVGGPNGEYSFKQMQIDFSGTLGRLDNSRELLTKEDLKKIASLPDIVDSSGDRRISDVVEGILTAGVQKDLRLASNKFILHMEDAKARQEFDIRSKVSASFQNLKEKVFNNSIPEAVKNSCPRAKDTLAEAKKCLEDLKTLSSTYSTNNEFVNFINRLEPTLSAGLSYHTKLIQDISTCQDKLKNGNSDEEMADACLNSLTLEETDLSSEIQQLSRLIDAIAGKDAQAIKLRNFALHRWSKECSGQDIAANVDFCDLTGSPLSKDNYFSVANSLEIALLYKPVEVAQEEGKAVCDNWPSDKPKPIVCQVGSGTSTIPPVVVASSAATSNPTEPDNSRQQRELRDAWVGVAQNLANQAMGYALRPPPFMPNPYFYNGPIMPIPRPLGISDSILFNATTQGGYGAYRPTPGLVPGTAFSYRPVSGLFGR